jgi:N-glycosylase/DNA lyase
MCCVLCCIPVPCTATCIVMPISRSWSSIPITLSNLTLANTLPVGQSFLWHRYPVELDGEEFARAVDNPPRVVRLRQTPTQLQYAVVYPDAVAEQQDQDYVQTRRWIHDYFQLDHNLDELYAEWKSRDPSLFGKIDIDGRAVGVRLLRQDPWECLVA